MASLIAKMFTLAVVKRVGVLVAIAILENLAKRTTNTLDDTIVAEVKASLQEEL